MILDDNNNYTARELAEYLKVAEWRIHEVCRLRILPHFRMGCQLRFSGKAVREFCESGGKTYPDGRKASREANENDVALKQAPRVDRRPKQRRA